jgi:hypothetical protein
LHVARQRLRLLHARKSYCAEPAYFSMKFRSGVDGTADKLFRKILGRHFHSAIEPHISFD